MNFCLSRRICTNFGNPKIKTAKLTVKNSPKHPSKIIYAGIKKVSENSMEVLRAKKNLSETSNLPFVSTFNPNNIFAKIKDTIKNL